jgi:hypothetical protein
LLAGKPLSSAELAKVGQTLADEQRETQAALLKIYSPDRRTWFSTDGTEVGIVEDNPSLLDAVDRDVSSVTVETDGDGNNSYELYIPYRQDGGHVVAVFELYEPIAGFEALLWRIVRPVLVIPIALFGAMLAALTWLVWRAQADIDRRTGPSLRCVSASNVSFRIVRLSPCVPAGASVRRRRWWTRRYSTRTCAALRVSWKGGRRPRLSTFSIA